MIPRSVFKYIAIIAIACVPFAWLINDNLSLSKQLKQAKAEKAESDKDWKRELAKCKSNIITYQEKVKNKKGTQEIENTQKLDNSLNLLSIFQVQKTDTAAICLWFDKLSRKEQKRILKQ